MNILVLRANIRFLLSFKQATDLRIKAGRSHQYHLSVVDASRIEALTPDEWNVYSSRVFLVKHRTPKGVHNLRALEIYKQVTPSE